MANHALHPSNRPRLRLDELEAAIARRWELAQQVKDLEAEMKKLSEVIMTGLSAQGMTAYETEDLVASIVTQTRSTLSERRLLEQGVSSVVLEKAKVANTSRFVRVGKREEAEGD